MNDVHLEGVMVASRNRAEESFQKWCIIQPSYVSVLIHRLSDPLSVYTFVGLNYQHNFALRKFLRRRLPFWTSTRGCGQSNLDSSGQHVEPFINSLPKSCTSFVWNEGAALKMQLFLDHISWRSPPFLIVAVNNRMLNRFMNHIEWYTRIKSIEFVDLHKI